ncbi:MAG: hypothetical protein GWM92_09495 [Gemmatimonadetes bacterium]|nr:hypothetical protein [Gemmatimonadota bacterium]NIR78897.1 hypothetical protein [Gemmatimonadota bacterium]NIT87532.1 hypothetical protein [Gemmatimonadota bacterium]NIU31400.1 hypothetical protein [Gemmatimonadota bacterium]NIU36085.1 hypothetical protein [Gemmatimonadota bacterium]
MAAGARHTCALDDEGRTYCWGFNGEGQLGLAPGADVGFQPGRLPTEPRFVSLAAGSSYTCGLTGPGEVFCWGTAPRGIAVAPERIGPERIFTSVESRFGHLCGITADRRVACLGRGEAGQLGNGAHGEDASSSVPVPVEGLTDVRQLALGVTFSCALGGPEGPWCWGAHDAGALGLGGLDPGPCEAMATGFTCVPVPAAVDIEPTLSHLVAGYYHVCGLTGDGGLLCWGDQEERQLGEVESPDRCVWAPPSNAERACSRIPRTVDTRGNHFVSLRAGGFHTCGLTDSGEAFCWGSNVFGQLGLVPGGSSLGPSAVEGGLRWRDLALGQVHTCGITVEGGAYCWGDGSWRQLGSGDEQASRPVQVLPPVE